MGAVTEGARRSGSEELPFAPARMQALLATGLLDGSSHVLDGLARAAARLLSAPLVLVELLTPDGVRLVGMAGVEGAVAASRILPMSHSLCDVVVGSERPLVIGDLDTHPLGHDRDGLRALGARAYLGVPVTARGGRTLAAFSAFDRTVRSWTGDELATLQDLAAAAVSDIELRINRQHRRIREVRFNAFMDNSPLLAALVNERRELEYVNAAFEQHAAISRTELTGAALSAVAFSLTHALAAGVDLVLQTGENLERIEVVTTPAGEQRHWQLYAFPVPDEHERRVGLVVADITDRRRLEIQLERAQRLESIGQLAAGVAHEINTPVQYVSDNVRFLAETFDRVKWLFDPNRPTCVAGVGAAPSASVPAPCALEAQLQTRLGASTTPAFLYREVPAAFGQTIEGLERIAAIVRSVKQFAHPGGAEPELTDLNNALSLTLTITRNAWRYVAECETAFDAELPPIRCFVGELSQVFLNLVVNAADAMRESGRRGTLRVTSRRDGHDAVVEISDTGVGIPPAIADRVFDPFFTTKPAGSGTGQGLAIAYAVLQKHEGTLRFRSVEGQGTTFEVRLPIAGPKVP